MKLYAILLGWLVVLGVVLSFAWAFPVKVELPKQPESAEPTTLYLSETEVENTCLGQDSCTVGKFKIYPIPNLGPDYGDAHKDAHKAYMEFMDTNFAGQTPVIPNAVNPQKETSNAGHT